MSSEEGKILFKDLSYTIVGLAIGIHNELGAGFLEKVYENAMAVSLRKEGIAFQQQVKTPIYFQGEVVGDYTADLVVDDKIILELKAVDAIVDIHKAQVLNYLKATGLRLGIVINFGKEKLQIERVVL